MKYKCKHCDRIYPIIIDSIECCYSSFKNLKFRYECGICEKEHSLDRQANKCCLNKKIEEIEE